MREILFRGKRIDNDKWVYGSFCMDAREFLKGLCGVDGFIRRYEPDKGQVQMYEVDRETVGQFTGLTDKNGKRIFEGDVLKEPDIVHNGEVQWHGHIYSAAMRKGCWCVIDANFIDEWDFLSTNAKQCEVIGNIHDNPELLKEDS